MKDWPVFNDKRGAIWRIALSDLLSRFENFAYAGTEPWQPWQPREGLIAHGPASLPIRFEVKRTESARV
jgi:hypothetical protein